MLPQVFIDHKRVRQNLERVFHNPLFSNINFRPHFKTHQSVETGRVFREFGIDKITVSSFPMAEYFANDGWQDIMIAIPINPADSGSYSKLADKISLHFLVDSAEAAEIAMNQIQNSVTFHIKCDCGYGRAGIPVQNKERFSEIIKLFSTYTNHDFGGLVSHFGNSYHLDEKGIFDINLSGTSDLRNLKTYLETLHGLNCSISIGDTPSLRLYNDEILNEIDEIRPGNFVYYDVMQFLAGHCQITDIAAALEVPFLSLYPERNEVLVHGGAVHLSKESCPMPDGKIGYGVAIRLSENGIGEVIQGAFVDRLSQEHGILRVQPGFFNEFKPGDSIGILPVHSCLMVSAMK